MEKSRPRGVAPLMRSPGVASTKPLPSGPGPFNIRTCDRVAARWLIGFGVAAVVCFLAFAAMLAAYLLKNDGRYTPYFDQAPASASESVLDCSGDSETWWAAASPTSSGGHATTRCVFTGDFTTGKGVTEQEVRAKCSRRADCGGYTVKQTVKYAQAATCSLSGTCQDESTLNVTGDCAGAIDQAYNKSMPEYMLISRAAAKNLLRASDAELGTNRETRVVTYRRG